MKRKINRIVTHHAGPLADTGRRGGVIWGLLGALAVSALLTSPFLLGLGILAAGAALFVLASFAASLYMVRLPYATRSDRIYGWMAFIGWLLGWQRSSYLIENVTTRRTIPSGAGLLPGIVLVDGHSVLVTKQFSYHHRVLGPGVHFTQALESVPVYGDGGEPARVHEAIDLRRQMRSVALLAQTRDGLFVNANLWTIFQIDRDPDPALDEHNFFRFYEQSVYAAVMAERVGAKQGETHDWTTLPVTLGRDAALQAISTYTLDELYAPRGDSDGFHPMDMRRKLGAEIAEAIREPLKGKGIQLIAAGVTKIMPADVRVTQQRVLNWRATRQTVVTTQAAEATALVEQQMDVARSKAQLGILAGMLTGLKSVDERNRRMLVALRLATALEMMFSRRAGMPPAAPRPDAATGQGGS
ncbi:MAG: SPFH domain-containing protein [Chloroflexi bacterium]|nr:SPFH domain-containing protein [Chloroflexota bacterium]